MRKCSHCGAELKDTAKFCPKCGNKTEGVVEAAKAENVEETTAPASAKTKVVTAPKTPVGDQQAHSKKANPVLIVLLIVLAVAVCAAGFAYYYFCVLPNSDRSTTEVSAAVLEEKMNKAYQKYIDASMAAAKDGDTKKVTKAYEEYLAAQQVYLDFTTATIANEATSGAATEENTQTEISVTTQMAEADARYEKYAGCYGAQFLDVLVSVDGDGLHIEAVDIASFSIWDLHAAFNETNQLAYAGTVTWAEEKKTDHVSGVFSHADEEEFAFSDDAQRVFGRLGFYRYAGGSYTKSEFDSKVQKLMEPNLSGLYSDDVNHAKMHVRSDGDACAVEIMQPTSASTMTCWEMTAKIENGRLVYSDLTCQLVQICDDLSGYESNYNAWSMCLGEELSTLIAGGEGYFTLTDSGMLWDGAAQEECRGFRFRFDGLSTYDY